MRPFTLSLFVAALRPHVTDREAARMLDHIDSSVQAGCVM